MESNPDNTPTPRKREANLSKDGQWRSFPNVPCLLQYVSNGNYYGRTRVNGKLIRVSLKTTVWTTAKLRLADLLKTERENSNKVNPPKFSEAVEVFKKELANDTTIKPQSKKYRLWCLGKLQKTWPALWELRLDEITPKACQEWAAGIHDKIACHYYNNTIGTLKQVIQSGITTHKENCGVLLENPAAVLKKTRIKQKDLRLPEPAHFQLLVENVRKRSGGWGPRVGDLMEFLTYSGTRIKEAIYVTWEDVDWKQEEIVVRGKPVPVGADPAIKNREIRRIPIIENMEKLLGRLKNDLGGMAKGRIMQVSKCNEALARACREIGIQKITHHDLRHLFATRCIESGVDIQTVSRWLGHKDGGALAMKTYGHLRNEHSRKMGKQVKF